jgi:hypothetical protein
MRCLVDALVTARGQLFQNSVLLEKVGQGGWQFNFNATGFDSGTPMLSIRRQAMSLLPFTKPGQATLLRNFQIVTVQADNFLRACRSRTTMNTFKYPFHFSSPDPCLRHS